MNSVTLNMQGPSSRSWNALASEVSTSSSQPKPSFVASLILAILSGVERHLYPVDLNRLADYRKEIQMAYSAFVREGHPPDECEAFRKEANELLKEYELDPLDEPGRKPKGRKSARKESGK